MRLVSVFILSLLLAPQPGWGRELVLQIGSQAVHAELAATQAEREQGLMHRTSLCADCGMLFVFPAAGRYSFWMKDTPIPLSIAFIAPDGRIINTGEMAPETLTPHTADGDALYALEMPAGWYARHHIKPGDTVTGLANLSATN